MFQVTIGDVIILYTGDFSRYDDRHLCGAEVPPNKPHVLIVESTFGVSNFDSREDRERIFTRFVRKVVSRGGKCLIPVFALGRAQELLLPDGPARATQSGGRRALCFQSTMPRHNSSSRRLRGQPVGTGGGAARTARPPCTLLLAHRHRDGRRRRAL